jgi:long-subunit fatty acid transport protein
MRKLLFLLVLSISQLITFAQVRSHLPYSIFGIGEICTKGSVRNMGMGRSGIALSSDLFLNNQNPASYHTLDSVSFFFDIGMKGDIVKYKTSSITQHGNDVNLRNISLGFRITPRWSASMGIAPYSIVGYKIVTEREVEGTYDKYEAVLTGEGGLTQFYLDNSYLLFKNLSLGVNLTYLFGNIESIEKLTYDVFNEEIYTKQLSYLDKVYADFGLQYFFHIKKKTLVTLGGVFGNSHQMNFEERINIYDSDGNVLEDNITGKGTFEFPYYWGGGISVQYDKKLTFSADYMYYNWSQSTQKEENFTYRNTNFFRFGAEYTPGRLNQYGYLGRISYRAGYYHDDSYLEINNKGITDKGFSLGIGIPFIQNKTSINIAYNVGKKGTVDNGLIQENYHSIMISLNLHDWWFIKRKFD